MAMDLSFSGQLAALYANVLDKTFERWHIALNEAAAGTYTADHAVQDVVLQWYDYLRFASFTGTAYTGSQLFAVTLNFKTTDNTATSGPVLFPNLTFTPDVTTLDELNGMKSIPKANIAVTYAAASRTLVMNLNNLLALNLNKGTYTGRLFEPGVPSNALATVTATVS